MDQAALQIVFVAMPEEARGLRRIEMTPVIRRLVIVVMSIAAAVVAALAVRGRSQYRKAFTIRALQCRTLHGLGRAGIDTVGLRVSN